MDEFKVLVKLHSSVGNVNGTFEVFVQKSDTLNDVCKRSCIQIGIPYHNKLQFANSSIVMIPMESTIESNNISDGSSLLLMDLEEKKAVNNFSVLTSTVSRFWKPLTIIAASLSICGFIILISIYVVNCMRISSFSVVIDAGSTSSKLFLYTWPSNKFTTNAKVEQMDYCKTEHGVSAYENNPNLCADEISHCLKQFMPKIPIDRIKSSYLFLGATAGMRMLWYKNPNATEAILKELRHVLTNVSLKVPNPTTDVSIISGSTEGISGWITANYLYDKFEKSSGATYGALDMGGASAQITYAVNDNSSPSKLKRLTVYGKTYSLYSHSYLCYGKSQAEFRFLAVLLKMNNFSTSSPNPCIFPDQTFSFTSDEIFYVPCVRGKFAIDHYGYEINPPDDWLQNPRNVTFNGTQNYPQCQELVATLFSVNKSCSQHPCTFNGVYQPELSGQFAAFSAFKFLNSYLNITNDKTPLKEYRRRLELLCDNQKWAASFLLPLQSSDDSWIKWKCFDSNFMLKFLENIYFNESNWDRLTFTDETINSKMGWSLGYMINKTALLTKEQPFLPLSDQLFAILFVIFFIILVMSVIFAICMIKRRRVSKCNVSTDHHASDEELLSSLR